MFIINYVIPLKQKINNKRLIIKLIIKQQFSALHVEKRHKQYIFSFRFSVINNTNVFLYLFSCKQYTNETSIFFYLLNFSLTYTKLYIHLICQLSLLGTLKFIALVLKITLEMASVSKLMQSSVLFNTVIKTIFACISLK